MILILTEDELADGSLTLTKFKAQKIVVIDRQGKIEVVKDHSHSFHNKRRQSKEICKTVQDILLREEVLRVIMSE